jgi:DUF1680 family protein
MAPHLMRAHPKVEETRNQVAVMQGPVVYCLESVDLPEGTALSDIYIPRDIQLKPYRVTGILSGLTFRQRLFRVVREIESDRLYHNLETVAEEDISVHLIPYFAWRNRGKSEMAV